jgi:hypothetical protein
MPINYLIIQSIKKYGDFYDGSLTVEYPTGSGRFMELNEVAVELIRRVTTLFIKDDTGARRLHGQQNWFYSRPENQDLVLFYEYFHGDTGRGLGASHQSGWTALIAELINELSDNEDVTVSLKKVVFDDEE